MRYATLLAVLLCAGCASSGVSRDVMDLARSTREGGSFHIEFDANGKFLEAGAEAALADLPAACREAADAAFPGGSIVGVGRVHVPGRVDWMVAKTIDGKAYEILVSANGVVRGGEEQLLQTEWPEKVLAAAKAAVPGAKLVRVERVWGDEAVGAERFHVKFDSNGESVRVGVTAEGSVTRVVRRVAGQTRFPR